MSRRIKPEKREVIPDVKFGSEHVQMMINRIMLNGKKSTVASLVYDAFDQIQAKTGKEGVEVFEQALKNVGPMMEVRPRRVGGATYQVPMEIREDRRLALALRWLIQNSRKRAGKSMVDRLSGELFDAFNNQGNTVKKREDTHKMAEANRAFAHYRW